MYKLLQLFCFISIVAYSHCAGSPPRISVNIKDFTQLKENVIRSLNIGGSYSAEIPNTGVEAGVSYEYNRDQLVPSRFIFKRSFKSARQVFHTIARVNAKDRTGELTVAAIREGVSIKGGINSKGTILPLEAQAAVNIDGRDISFNVVHDINNKKGAVSVATDIAPDTLADLQLQGDGEIDIILRHKRILDKRTTLLAQGNVMDFVQYGAKAIGRGFCTAKIIRKLDDVATLSVDLCDNGRLHWSLAEAQTRNNFELAGTLFLDRKSQPTLSFKHTTTL